MTGMKLGFIQWNDPFDRKASSGTPYKMAESLRKRGFDVVWVRARKDGLFRLYSRLVSLFNRMSPKRIDASHSVIGASLVSRTLDKTAIASCDALFAPFSSECLYLLKTGKPVVYLSDATFRIMNGYYFRNLSKCSIHQGDMIESHAIGLAAEVIVSSDWAAESVVSDYGKDPANVHVLEFGANIDEKDIVPGTSRYEGHLDLLFLGVDWVRKGGSVAVEACRWLNDNGIPSTLHVAGIKDLPVEIRNLPYVDHVGFLNKNIPEDYQRLVDLIRKCHCLLLPTLAECSAIAFCESSANGLPVFSHRTGGVGNYVMDGENGWLLPLGSTGEDFGRKIKECLDSGELERMSETARELYRRKLNWKVWAEKAERIIVSAVSPAAE